MTYKRNENKTQPKLCLACKVVPDKDCIDKKEELMAQELTNPYPESTWCERYRPLYEI